MSSLIGALRVTLGIDTAAFSTGLDKAESKTRRVMSGITKGLVAFASGVGLAAITGLAQRALEYASSLSEVAQQLGVTTNELQEYRYAASQVGIEQETMDKALAKLTRTIGQAATGGKAQAAVFDALGISVRDANGEVRTAGEIIPELADALEKVPDAARRAAVETQLFGRAGQQLDTLLSGGSGAINALRDAAHELGIVLSAEQIQKADETADKLSAMKQVLEARIAGVVADNADSILALADALSQLVVAAGNAAKAWRILQFTRGQISEDLQSRGFAGTPETRAMHSRNADRYRAAIAKEMGSQDKTGGFRDYSAAPIPDFDPKAKPKPKPLVPTPDLDNISGGGGGGRRDNSAEEAKRAADEARRRKQQHEDEVRSLQLDELRLREEMADGLEARNGLQKQQLDLEYEGEKSQVQFQLDMKEITGAQATKLLAMKAVNYKLNVQKLELDRQQQLLEQQWMVADERVDMEQDRLQIEADLTRTARDRREVENRILDNRLAQEREEIRRVLDDPKKIDQWGSALQRRDWLDKNEGGLRQQVSRQNMTPLEAFFDKLPQNAAEANAALEGVAAGGIQSIVDGLADAATGARSLGDVFKNVARQIIADLIRIQIQKAIVSGLRSILNIGGAAAGTPVVSGGTGFGPALPNFASGGVLKVGGRPGVDTNLLSINGQPRAMVSASEHLAVIPNNKGGGRGAPIVFDLRGAVMTADLVAQMQKIAVATGGAAAIAGGAMGEQRVLKRASRRIPGF